MKNIRTKSELLELQQQREDIEAILIHCNSLGIHIPEECDTIEALTDYFKQRIESENIITDEDGRHHKRYDTYTAGTYIAPYHHTEEWHGRKSESRAEWYKVTLMDLFREWLQVVAYKVAGFTEDYAPRQIIVPVSACDLHEQDIYNNAQ